MTSDSLELVLFSPPPIQPQRKTAIAALAFSLRWYLLTVALIAVSFRVGYLVGYKAGWLEAPFRGIDGMLLQDREKLQQALSAPAADSASPGRPAAP